MSISYFRISMRPSSTALLIGLILFASLFAATMSELSALAAMRAGIRAEETEAALNSTSAWVGGENQTAAQIEHRNPLKQTKGSAESQASPSACESITIRRPVEGRAAQFAEDAFQGTITSQRVRQLSESTLTAI